MNELKLVTKSSKMPNSWSLTGFSTKACEVSGNATFINIGISQDNNTNTQYFDVAFFDAAQRENICYIARKGNIIKSKGYLSKKYDQKEKKFVLSLVGTDLERLVAARPTQKSSKPKELVDNAVDGK